MSTTPERLANNGSVRVAVGFALEGLFLWIYVLITPWREFALIRAGNSAAAVALVGEVLKLVGG